MDFLNKFKKSPNTLLNEHFFRFIEFILLHLGTILTFVDPIAAIPNLFQFILHSWLESYLKTTSLILTRPALGQELDENQVTWIHIYGRAVLVIFLSIFPLARMSSKRFVSHMGLDFEALLKVLQDTRYINCSLKRESKQEDFENKNKVKSNVLYYIFNKLMEKKAKKKEGKVKTDSSKTFCSSFTNFFTTTHSENKSSKDITNFLKVRNVFSALLCESVTYLIPGLFMLGFGMNQIGIIITPEQTEKYFPQTMYAKIYNKEVKFLSIIEVYFYWSIVFKYGIPLIYLSLLLALTVVIFDIVITFILRFFFSQKLLFSPVLSYWAMINIDSGIVFDMCDANLRFHKEKMWKYYKDKEEEENKKKGQNQEEEEEEASEMSQSGTEYLSSSSIFNLGGLRTNASSGRLGNSLSTLRI